MTHREPAALPRLLPAGPADLLVLLPRNPLLPGRDRDATLRQLLTRPPDVSGLRQTQARRGPGRTRPLLRDLLAEEPRLLQPLPALRDGRVSAVFGCGARRVPLLRPRPPEIRAAERCRSPGIRGCRVIYRVARYWPQARTVWAAAIMRTGVRHALRGRSGDLGGGRAGGTAAAGTPGGHGDARWSSGATARVPESDRWQAAVVFGPRSWVSSTAFLGGIEVIDVGWAG